MTKERLEQIRLEVNFLDCHPWDDETQGMMIELLAELDNLDKKHTTLVHKYAEVKGQLEEAREALQEISRLKYGIAANDIARKALGDDR